MASALTFVSENLVHFQQYFCWVSLKHFAIDGSLSDADLLSRLREHHQYHDHYAGQEVSEQDHHSLHGPYWLSRISADSFQPADSHVAEEALKFWAATWAEEADVSAIENRLQSEVVPWLGGQSIYALRNLGEDDRHDWGWVVGASGFLEYVVIDQVNEVLTLLVASDD